ncbi:hypothetical protein SISNIDRAFT_471467 [Sistotremastrum niveocremeum HHB9708]|uniref:Uncharacterized protein n=1 Tax=Sistotremastrum niveocremeum HHB9708 TaxID=1314777 RepID=A0A164MLM8_9AGAM|nr:hypothetical protein SISNIDRAFT_471467 [Sistotremastrum niveocremeum HHB9708]
MFSSKIETHVDPSGFTTLEVVLEELIGGEIYDGFDSRTASASPASPEVPPETERAVSAHLVHPATAAIASHANVPSIDDNSKYCLPELCIAFYFARKNQRNHSTIIVKLLSSDGNGGILISMSVDRGDARREGILTVDDIGMGHK